MILDTGFRRYDGRADCYVPIRKLIRDADKRSDRQI